MRNFLKNWLGLIVATVAVLASLYAVNLDRAHFEQTWIRIEDHYEELNEQFNQELDVQKRSIEEQNRQHRESLELQQKLDEEQNRRQEELVKLQQQYYDDLIRKHEESLELQKQRDEEQNRQHEELVKLQQQHYDELRNQYEDLIKPHTKFDEIRDRLARLDEKIERTALNISYLGSLVQDITEHQNSLSEAKQLRDQAELAWDIAHYDEADESISEAHILLDKIPTTLPPPGTTFVSHIVTEEGVFTKSVTVKSEDNTVQLTIKEGTTGKTKEGEPLGEITVIKELSPPQPPSDNDIIGLTYNIGPDGATFDPPITITFTYDPAGVPEGVDEEDLVIASWDEDAGEWVVLEDITVERVINTISALVSHFTAFTIIAYLPPVAPPAPVIAVPPAPAITITPPEIVLPPAPAPPPPPQIVIPPAPAPPAPITPAYIWGIIIITIILVITVIVLIARTRRRV